MFRRLRVLVGMFGFRGLFGLRIRRCRQISDMIGSFSRRLWEFTGLCAVLVVISAVQAEAEDLRQFYEQIHAANRLDAKGQTPFHIKIAAQLYDLNGKPAGTGTAEEWWAAGRYRIELEGPNGKEIQTSDVATSEATPSHVQRSNYLLHVLLDQNVNPLSDLPERAKILRVDREFEQTKFRCLSVDLDDSLYCTPLAGTDLRVLAKNASYVGLRNQIGRFHGSTVALKTASMYGNKPAVTGEVTLLQNFDSSSSSFPEFQVAGVPVDEPKSTANGQRGVTAGHPLSHPSPEYPETAKLGHIRGTVDLIGIITREGRIGSIDVLASPSPILSNAVLDAIRKWTFTPYLLNGKVTEVTEVFQFNFLGH